MPTSDNAVLGTDDKGRDVQALTIPQANQTTVLSTSGTSAATSALTGGIYRLTAVTEDCYICLDATADSSDMLIRANVEEYFRIPDGSAVHAIATTSGTLRLTKMA